MALMWQQLFLWGCDLATQHETMTRDMMTFRNILFLSDVNPVCVSANDNFCMSYVPRNVLRKDDLMPLEFIHHIIRGGVLSQNPKYLIVTDIRYVSFGRKDFVTLSPNAIQALSYSIIFGV